MKKNKIEELIAEYLSGEMDMRDVPKFKELLTENGYDLSELEKLEHANDILDNFAVPEPSAEMHAKFFSMLEDSKRELNVSESILELNNSTIQHKSLSDRIMEVFQVGFAPKFAYSMALLIIGWAIGQTQLLTGSTAPGQQYADQLTTVSAEVRQIREMMIFTLANQPSASERIRTVNLTNSFDDIDEKVIDALLNTLNTDPNVNVRLVTVEALTRFTDNKKVRTGLIESLNKQDSPLLQISLADAMVSMSEKSSVGALQALADKKDLNSAVKTRIEKCIKVLS